MGAWGDQPKDNDSSADLFDDVITVTANAVHKIFKKTYPNTDARWDRLGVLQRVVEDMPIVVEHLQDDLKSAYNDVEMILEDDDWIQNWKSPTKVVTNLRAFQRKIKSILLKM